MPRTATSHNEQEGAHKHETHVVSYCKTDWDRGIGSGFDELAEVASADHAGLVLVAAGTGPMGFEVDITVVAVANKRIDLAAPFDILLTERTPDWRVTLQFAVLGVNVRDP